MFINCAECGALIDLENDPLPDLDDLAGDQELNTICRSCALEGFEPPLVECDCRVLVGIGGIEEDV